MLRRQESTSTWKLTPTKPLEKETRQHLNGKIKGHHVPMFLGNEITYF